MRPLLVGDKLGKDGGRPLEGRVGKRLARLAGWTYEQYLEGTERVNVHDADGLFLFHTSHRVVILLGREAASHFSFDRRERFLTRQYAIDGALLVLFPHPSGRNRWWNDPGRTAQAAEILRLSLGPPTSDG